MTSLRMLLAAALALAVPSSALAQSSQGASPLTIVKGGTAAATAAGARTNLGLAIGSNVQAWDSDLDCIAAISSTGIIARTGAGSCAARTLTPPAAGLTISNGSGVAGNPTLALANDLAALEALSGTGIAVRSGADAWVQRSIMPPAAGLTVGNGDGVAGNPTLALANDLAALEALSGTGLARRTGTDAWSVGTTVAVSEGGTGGATASGTLLDNITGFSGTGFLTRTGAGAYTFQSATNGVTNGNLAQAGAATLKGNPTGSTANVSDFTIQGLTARGAPDAANDKLPIYDNAAGTIKYVTPAQIAGASSGTVTSIGAGTGLTGGTITTSGTIAVDKATGANYFAGASNKVPTTDVIYQPEVPVTYGTTTTFDFTTFINASVSLTGNITTMTFSNVIAGKAGSIRFIQDATGSRTTVWNSILKWAGGNAPTLSTAANAVDVLNYNCMTATFCQATLTKDSK